MTFRKISIFPIQAQNLNIEEIYFVKTLTLFIHLSFESFLYLNSNIIKLITNNGDVVPEEIYIDYAQKELLDRYSENSSAYIILFDVVNKKDKHIITYYIYNNPNKELINTKSYILSQNLFENTYKTMIMDILKYTNNDIYFIDDFLSNIEIFNELKNIITNDNIFFNNTDNIKFIEGLENIYSLYREPTIIRYIVKKLLTINNIFFVNKIIQKLKDKDKENDYSQFLLATTLMELKQYKAALNILNSMKEDSLFLKLRAVIVYTLKAEANLKLNELASARISIIKAMKLNIPIKASYELFLEIMYKSKFFLAFKSYLKQEKFISIQKESVKASYWIAKYYSEVSIDNSRALYYIENFKYDEEIIFLYIKILYRLSLENNNKDKFDSYVLDLYKQGILNAEETTSNNLKYVKMFITIYTNLNQKNNLTNIFIKEKINIIEYDELLLNFLNIEEIIFNKISQEIKKGNQTIYALLLFILKDYNIGIKELIKVNNKELYYYSIALVDEKKRFKFLKKAFKVNKDISILNKIIIYTSGENSYFNLNKYLNKRKKYIKNDSFDIFYTIKKFIITKKYKLALKLIENKTKEHQEELFDFLKSEIYFKMREYDQALNILKKYNNKIIKNYHLSYMNGYILSKIKNNRRGVFYLQNSYNINPNKKLHKELIKEYKKYGIEYL